VSDDLGFRFRWLGHAAIHIETAAGTSILIDPWLTNPRSPVLASSIGRCDVMLVTHGHHDHLGAMPGSIAEADAISIARRTRPAWPAIHEMALWLETLGLGADIVPMNKGGSVEVRGIRVSMVPADHSGGDIDTATGLPTYLGEPVGFVVELEDGQRLYHAGDTALFGDMRLIGELHHPDLAFLPIGGHFTMDAAAAARAAELLGVSTVVPIHYGTFPVLAGTPDELREALRRLGLGDVLVLAPEPGVTVS
jgi:L-ascorbate metabolism protein UlaG (beta-lactamase superfamily)